MIQRIQSLYLALVCIFMTAFLRATIWVKVDLNNVFTMRAYALTNTQEKYIIFPYGFCALLASCLAVTAAYAIMRHDNRSLQLRLIARINLILISLLLLIFVLIKKAHGTYLLTGYTSYKIGFLLPFMALAASLLARYHIKKDEVLVNEDRLR